MPSFSTDQYAWKDIKVVLFGRIPLGIQDIKYKVNSDDEFVYGRGKKPLAVQKGNEAIEGQVVLLQFEYDAIVEAIQDVNPGAKITDLSTDIIISYGEGNLAKTDRVVGATFGEFEKGMGQGDKFMAITLPFKAIDVLENI